MYFNSQYGLDNYSFHPSFQGRERTEANEQRLPLKKRHRHISTAVPATPEPPKVDNIKSEVNVAKTSEKANCAEKETRLEKQDKEKVDKNEQRAEKVSVPKSGLLAETHKPVRTENKLIRQSSYELNKKSDEAEIISTVTKKLDDEVVSKTTDAEEPLKITEVVALKKADEAEKENKATRVSISADPVENKTVEKSDTVSKATEMPISTRTTTTTPKKRHRLEVDLSTSPAATTRANVGLVKSKTEKEIPKVKEKEVTTPKTPVTKSPKANKEPCMKEVETPPPVPPKAEEKSPEDSPKIMPVEEEKPSNDTSVTKPQEPVEPVTETSIAVESKPETEPLKESSGTHSDSDIPSEHEPLYESDQSGFMSDKEGPKEIPVKVPQKRRKKKRELRSPIPKVTDKPTPAEVTEDNEPPPPKKKKKVKRRKTNRTGFPTIRKKKRKPKDPSSQKDEENGEEKSPDVESSVENTLECDSSEKMMESEQEKATEVEKEESLDHQECETEEVKVSAEKNEKSISKSPVPKPVPRPRGRPKKINTEAKPPRTPSESPSQSPEKAPKQLRESLRERRSGKVVDPPQEDKITDPDQDEQQLEKILERVATGIGGRTRRKRDLSEESVKTVQSEGKRQKRHVEDDVSISVLQFSRQRMITYCNPILHNVKLNYFT